MGVFNFFKKKDPIQEYLDGFFKNLVIVDVVSNTEIPILNVDGNLQKASAEMYFTGQRTQPYCIDMFIKDYDAIFWIFETYFVFELNIVKPEDKVFIVMEPESQYKKNDLEEMQNHFHAMELAISITMLRKKIHDIPALEAFVFRDAWKFIVENNNEIIKIGQKKYS